MAGHLLLVGPYDPQGIRLQTLLAGWAALGGTHEAWGAGEVFPPAGQRVEMLRHPSTWVGPLWRVASAGWTWSWQAKPKVKPTAILVPWPGHLAMGAARRMATAWGLPLVLDPFLGLVDTVVGDRQLWRADGWRAQALARFERRSLQQADFVLADTPMMARRYAELADLAPETLLSVPVGADGTAFHPRVAPEANKPDRQLEVLFVGSMLPLHGMDTVVAAMRVLQAHPTLCFRMIGRGEADGGLSRLQLPHLQSQPPLPYEALPAAYARADLVLGHFGSSPKAERVVPHKVHEAAAMGKAIVARASEAMDEAYGGAYFPVPAKEPQALAAALAALAADPQRRLALGAAARARFLARFDAPLLAEVVATGLQSWKAKG